MGGASFGPPGPDADASGTDLRMVVLAAAGWGGALVALLLPPRAAIAALVCTAGAALALLAWRHRPLSGAIACLLVAGGIAGSALVRADATAHSPVAELAEERAVVRATLQVTSDPVVRDGRFSEVVVFRARVHRVLGRGADLRLRVPVLVIADGDWAQVPLGAVVEPLGRLGPADDDGVAGVLAVHGDPAVRADPGPWWRMAAAVRASVGRAAGAGPAGGGALVPALVVGDDSGLDEDLAEDFRVTGMTHLLAVSGTNLTIVLGFVLWLARWCGVRGRWQLLVGALAIAGFVLVARTEPSVVRAAAMGVAGLLGLGSGGRRRGSRALGVAVVLLLLMDPRLAVSVGFVLSVLATAGILFLAPGWRDALAGWLPRPVAEAVAVPAAAQLACTPVVAAIAGQVSLVAVAANLVAAPAVGPATVLGLLGGLAGLVADPAGYPAGWLGAWAAGWIVMVAEQGAAVPTPAVGWGTGALPVLLLTLACAAAARLIPAVLRRRGAAMGGCAVLVAVVLVPLPTPGWPPAGWVMVACDVGQGDALVVNAGQGRALLVDAGPHPGLVDRCLDRLDVHALPLVVLTHFHADHVDGLTGALAGRQVGWIEVSPLAEPAGGAAAVAEVSRGRAPVLPAPFGATRTFGEVTLQVLGPPPSTAATPVEAGDPGAEGEDGAANNASVVLLVAVQGVRLLLTGDVEPEAQAALRRSWPGLTVDVLKIPHHGSRHQDVAWLTTLGARLAVASVGENDYGHPSSAVITPLEEAGASVVRTDLLGDLAVSVRSGDLFVTGRG